MLPIKNWTKCSEINKKIGQNARTIISYLSKGIYNVGKYSVFQKDVLPVKKNVIDPENREMNYSRSWYLL